MLTRGDVVLVRLSGTPAGKARPCLIVQRSSTLADTTKISVCPFTSVLRGAVSQRPPVAPSEDNGLDRPSEVEVDWIYTFERDAIGERIGTLDPATMRLVDAALRRWLDL